MGTSQTTVTTRPPDRPSPWAVLKLFEEHWKALTFMVLVLGAGPQCYQAYQLGIPLSFASPLHLVRNGVVLLFGVIVVLLILETAVGYIERRTRGPRSAAGHFVGAIGDLVGLFLTPLGWLAVLVAFIVLHPAIPSALGGGRPSAVRVSGPGDVLDEQVRGRMRWRCTPGSRSTFLCEGAFLAYQDDRTVLLLDGSRLSERPGAVLLPAGRLAIMNLPAR